MTLICPFNFIKDQMLQGKRECGKTKHYGLDFQLYTFIGNCRLGNGQVLHSLIGFIECFTTTFLHTHHSLLAKLGRWGWLTRMRLAWKTLDTVDIKEITSKQDPTYQECRQRKGFPILSLSENADSKMGRVVTAWRVHGTVDSRETPVQQLQFCLRFIYNRPPSRPHQVTFYDKQEEGCLLLPRSSPFT